MTDEIIVMVVGVGAVAVVLVVSYVDSFVAAFRQSYLGPRVFSTWELIKMGLRELVGRGS